MASVRLVAVDSRSFLSRVIAQAIRKGRLTESQVDDLQEQVAAISHKLFLARSRDLSSPTEAKQSVGSAFANVSLGLEYASGRDVDEAIALLAENDAVIFFRIGHTLLRRLVREARQIREEAVLVSPEHMRGISQMEERIETYNVYEQRFLNALEKGQINIAASELRLRANMLPRPLSTLQEYQVARNMLDNLRYRSEYLHTLPVEAIFDAEFPPDPETDMGCLITRHLIINLALYRQVEFHVSEEDLENFFELCWETSDGSISKNHRDFVLGWIQHHLDLKQVGPQVKRYTLAYWRECLRDLESLKRNRSTAA